MQTSQLSSGLSWPSRVAIAIGMVLALLPWSIGIDSPVLGQTIALEDSSKSPSAKKPKTSKSTMKGSSASASAGGFGVSGGSSSGKGSQGGFSFNSSTQVITSVDASVDKDGKEAKEGPTSPSTSSKSSPNTKRTSSSRSTSMSVTRELNEDGDTIKVTVQEPARQIVMTQSSDTGIDVRIIPTRKTGSVKEIHVTAEDADELKKKNPKAFAVYRKYLLPQLKGDGTTATAFSTTTADPEIAGGANAAQKMMRKKLAEMLENEAIEPAVREQIEGMIKNLPVQD